MTGTDSAVSHQLPAWPPPPRCPGRQRRGEYSSSCPSGPLRLRLPLPGWTASWSNGPASPPFWVKPPVLFGSHGVQPCLLCPVSLQRVFTTCVRSNSIATLLVPPWLDSIFIQRPCLSLFRTECLQPCVLCPVSWQGVFTTTCVQCYHSV